MAPSEFIASTQVRSDEGESVSDLALGLAAPPGTFFDLASVHLVTSAAPGRAHRLGNLGARFASERFRPNVVVDDAGEGFVEKRLGGRIRVDG